MICITMYQTQTNRNPIQILQKLYQLMKAVTATAEVVRYQNDIVIFLRLSRAVAGGISVKASKQLSSFARYVQWKRTQSIN